MAVWKTCRRPEGGEIDAATFSEPQGSGAGRTQEVDEGGEIERPRGREIQARPGRRMYQRQLPGVQCGPLPDLRHLLRPPQRRSGRVRERATLTAVRGVADQRMIPMRQVDADLMRPSGIQSHLEMG